MGDNDGAGVTVAFLADGLDTADADFQRNAAYGTPGQPVVKQYDFSSDGTNAPTQGNEAFGDASSIAAQGNTVYDLSQYVSTVHPLPSGCDIKIVGVAPGADVEALKVFATNNDTTESGFLEAINFAVASGAKVINESFASTSFPDTALDVTRDANDAAVAAGVTVVVSAGDAGNTSTIGSPATDPNVISVGATTTFRAYTQLTYGGINDPNASGGYVDNNISSLSSGGYTQAGNTVDLVAPGDLNWALCSPNRVVRGLLQREPRRLAIQLFGGTSESAPSDRRRRGRRHLGVRLDARRTRPDAGTGEGDPHEHGHGHRRAGDRAGRRTLERPRGRQRGQVDRRRSRWRQHRVQVRPAGDCSSTPDRSTSSKIPATPSNRSVQVTNTGADPVTVNLSTRALASTPVGSQSGEFCMEPRRRKPAVPRTLGGSRCGAASTMPIRTSTSPSHDERPSRLEFAADHTYTGPGALLNFALIEPNGTYAAYSLPQGLGDYGEVEVTNPPAGKWTAVFFTEGDDLGTSGTIRWSANTFTYVAGADDLPVDIDDRTRARPESAQLSLTSSNLSGDTSQSVVVTSPYGTTTVPVTVRTTVALGATVERSVASSPVATVAAPWPRPTPTSSTSRMVCATST